MITRIVVCLCAALALAIAKEGNAAKVMAAVMKILGVYPAHRFRERFN